MSECKLGAARLRKKERSADLKIYYDGRQCRGDPFKIRGTLKWNASKFSAQDRFVFNTPTIHTRRKAARVRDNGRRDGNLGDIFPLRSLPGALYPSEYKILQISRSDAYEPKFEGFEFDAYLVQLRDTGCENPPKRVYEKFQKSGKFSAEIALPDQKDASGETLLNLAIAADDAAAIPLDRGAEVNLAGAEGFMQVQRACFCKNENIFRILLSSGADVDAENDAKLSAQILRGRICGRKMQAS